jgi:hypothetical protein
MIDIITLIRRLLPAKQAELVWEQRRREAGQANNKALETNHVRLPGTVIRTVIRDRDGSRVEYKDRYHD